MTDALSISSHTHCSVRTQFELIKPRKSRACSVSFTHYGVIGDLDRVPFGATRAKCIELAGGIKTYTEQVGGRELSDQLTEEISRADCIVFIGFAYHQQNMHILSRITQWGRSPYSAPPSECRTPTLK